MNKLLSIVGPTATGKTQTALTLAKKILADNLVTGIDLISADSRQVYRGLEVLTGADIPAGFSQKTSPSDQNLANSCYANADNSIRLFGVSIIKPTDEWSVAHFQLMAREIIQRSWQTGRLPVLVGGTGLYHDQLLTSDTRLHIGPNPEVRQKAESMSLTELQHWLSQLDSQRLIRMNHSDLNNPRRLIRAIEIASAQVNHPTQVQLPVDELTLVLTAPLQLIEDKINKRVAERFQSGAVVEVQALLSQNIEPKSPVMSSLGVVELTEFLSGALDSSASQKLWALHELQYARRQITWWKNKSGVTRLDITQPDYLNQAENLARSWLSG